ncbi:TolC family protein [Sphingobacterium sp. DR205]|uniref:TolC family protein n=1 Tax=Sphingobacterium sp. DR205 TaxID=2713573 RepID=UPI0013E46E7F|nr:TolC family protein [Sphingobacterium sp. DR205]QIH35961.1 TolC family protein [Sphingobacterium sp. DR205]
MHIKISLLLLFSFIYNIQVKAQNKLDLKQCIDYGLKANPSTVIYSNEKKIADAKAKELLAEYLPGLDFSGTIDDNLKVQEQVIPAGLFGDEDIRVAFTKQFNTNGILQLNQTLFDGSVLVGLRAQKFNERQAELNQKKNTETIIYNIATAYYQILTYRRQLELLTNNIETYVKQLDIVSMKVKKGITLQKDLDKVRVDYNNTSSQIRVAKTNIELATNQLKYEMGFPMEQEVEIEDQKLEAKEITLSTLGDVNTRNISDYQLDMVNAELLQMDGKRIKAGYWPKLSAYARLGMNGFGDNLGQSFSSLQSFSSIGLKLSIPVFDGFRRNNQYKQAQYKYYNALEQNRLNEGKYKLDYENSKSKLYKSESTLDNDKRNMELAESVFQVTDLQYQKGVTDMTDWLNSQNSLREAQNSYLNSFYNLLQAKIDLEKSKGTLKQFYNSL